MPMFKMLDQIVHMKSRDEYTITAIPDDNDRLEHCNEPFYKYTSAKTGMTWNRCVSEMEDGRFQLKESTYPVFGITREPAKKDEMQVNTIKFRNGIATRKFVPSIEHLGGTNESLQPYVKRFGVLDCLGYTKAVLDLKPGSLECEKAAYEIIHSSPLIFQLLHAYETHIGDLTTEEQDFLFGVGNGGSHLFLELFIYQEGVIRRSELGETLFRLGMDEYTIPNVEHGNIVFVMHKTNMMMTGFYNNCFGMYQPLCRIDGASIEFGNIANNSFMVDDIIVYECDL